MSTTSTPVILAVGSNIQVLASWITANKEVSQRVLFVASVACGIIAAIPPLRLVGSLMMRSVALISSSLGYAQCGPEESRLTKIAKIAIVALGLIALMASTPILLIVSLAADIGLQAIELVKAAMNKEMFKVFAHVSVIVINTLVLAAIATGLWEVMVVATAVGALAMLLFALKAAVEAEGLKGLPGKLASVDVMCYFALSALGVATAYSIAELSRTGYKVKFQVKNSQEKETLYLYDKEGNRVATIAPGETVTKAVDIADTLSGLQLKGIVVNEQGSIVNELRIGGEPIQVRTVYHQPIAPALLPRVPTVDGTLGIDEITSKARPYLEPAAA
jgi:hypothetical protein